MAYFCLTQFNILPHEINCLSVREKALIKAIIDIKVEIEQEAAKKIKKGH